MTARAPRTRDRRVERTHRALREALIALLLERGWDGFSVRDVCDRADVGRSTFYLHFADKEDLLISGFQQLRTALRQQLQPAAGSGRPLAFARGLIEHIHDSQRMFRALLGKRSGYVVLRRFRELLIDLVREDLSAIGRPGPAREAAVLFIAGGFLELLTAWFENPRATPALADMERLLVNTAIPVIDAVGTAR